MNEKGDQTTVHGRLDRSGAARRPGTAVAFCILALGLSGCGERSTSTAQDTAGSSSSKQTASPVPTPTVIPTPTPRPPIPDAHLLTFQSKDIPAGYAPHKTSILTLDARTAVSEQLVRNGSVLTANGLISGAEFGWEATGTGRLAVQNAILVVRDNAAAARVLAEIAATAQSFGATAQTVSAKIGDAAQAYTKGQLVEVQWRRGAIVAAVEVTDGSLAHAVQLAQQLDARYTPYG